MTAELVSDASADFQTMSLDDFITGLLAGLAGQGVHVVSIRDREFYAAVEAVYQSLEAQAAKRSIELLFHIRRNRMYLDSPDVREGIARAVQRDLISLDNPEYQDMRLKVSAAAAPAYLDGLPGGPELFTELAAQFLECYPGNHY